eukprot:UN05863
MEYLYIQCLTVSTKNIQEQNIYLYIQSCCDIGKTLGKKCIISTGICA